MHANELLSAAYARASYNQFLYKMYAARTDVEEKQKNGENNGV